MKSELLALARCFWFHEGNSDVEKIVLWAGVFVMAVALTGVFFGLVDFEALPEFAKNLLMGFAAMLLYLFGRTHGKEVVLERYRAPPPPGP